MTWPLAIRWGSTDEKGLNLKLLRFLKRQSSAFTRCDDVVAVGKALDQLPYRLIGRYGIYEVTTGHQVREGSTQVRTLPVYVKTFKPVSRLTEYFVEYAIAQVNERFGARLRGIVLFEPR
jgi:hypothetical protein